MIAFMNRNFAKALLVLVGYSFTSLPSHALTLNEVQKLNASDAAINDFFGASVAVSEDTMVIGASYKNQSGSAYVYRFDGSNWIEEQQLTASDAAADDSFGTSVAVSGDTALIGANFTDGISGAVYVYRFDGSTWIEAQKLTASDAAAGDQFGKSVAVSGDTVVIGASVKDNASGSAYVYRFDGNTWIEEQKLTASDAAERDFFGSSVAISGDTLVIGAKGDDDKADDTGSAHMYRFDGNTWVEEQKLTASDAQENNSFGGHVSVSGDTVMIAASPNLQFLIKSGSTYVYRFDGSTWNQEQTIIDSDATVDDFFHIFSLAMSGDTAVIATNYADGGSYMSGAAYVYRFDGSTWRQEHRIAASDAAAGDLFGDSVAVSGDTVVVGASGDGDSWDDDIPANSGSAYVFSLNNDDDNNIECGQPDLDTEMDRGLFLWQDCGFNTFHVQANGGDRWGKFRGAITSDKSLSAPQSNSLEDNDQVTLSESEQRIDFSIGSIGPWFDEFSFDADADICVDVMKQSEGTGLYLGRTQQPVNGNFNPATGEACTLAE